MNKDTEYCNTTRENLNYRTMLHTLDYLEEQKQKYIWGQTSRHPSSPTYRLGPNELLDTNF